MKKPTNQFIIIISSIIFGLCAGFMGSILSSYYVGNDYSYQDLDLSNSIYNRSNLVIRDAKKVVVNQDIKVEETISSLQPLLVSAFKINKQSEYHVLAEADAFGLILSNDGWVLLNGFKGNDIKEIVKDYEIVSYDRKVYQIDNAAFVKIAGSDQVVLAHLKGASNLPVKQIINPEDLKVGSALIVLSSNNKTLVSYLSDKIRPSLQLKSDLPETRLLLNDNLAKDFEGALVFNFNGDFVGFVDSKNDLRPSYSFLPAWRSIIAKKYASFPSFGVSYLDLNKIKLLNSDLSKGAWLKSLDQKKSALNTGGAADLAGLKDGDIILKINNQELDATHDLSEIISAYLSGDLLRVSYLRDGKVSELELKLGEIK